MADERGYALASTITGYDGDLYLNADKIGFSRAKKYKLSVLKGHFKVGDQQYTEENYVSDDETLTVSADQLDMALKDLSDTVAALTFDNNGIIVAKVSLSAGNVATLGTVGFDLLAVPGASKAYKIIDITWACYPTTVLDVGSQDLIINVDGTSNYLSIIRNGNIETSSTLIKGVQVQPEYELGINKKISCQLRDGTDPVSGSASMTFWITYKILST